jgi:type I restriction enzyme, S subunit
MSAAPQKQVRIFDTTIEGELPDGWTGTTLDQILESLESGSRPKGGVRGISDGIPSIGGEHLNDNGGFRFDAVKFVPRSFFERMGRGHIKKGDILVVKDGATTGKVALVRDNFPYPTAVVNEHVFICRLWSGLYPPFFFYFLFSKEGQDRILENFRGSAQGGINQSFAPGTVIPVAPRPEQKRIVAKVEELLARVTASREHLSKAALTLKRFRQSVLAAACSGRLTESRRHDGDEASELPSGWRWEPVEELLTKGGIFDGPFGSNLKTSDYTANGVRVVRMENIGWLTFIGFKQAFISENKYQSLTRHTVGAGDIIFSSFIDDQIRSCVLPVLLTKAIAKADCFCLRPDSTLVDRHYLVLQLSSQESYNALRENIHGATRPRVNTTQVRRLSVRVCPLPEQHEIVRRVEALFKLADVIERRIETATKRADKLTQAILAKAFRGELVPTEAELARREGREYERASALLGRIRAERRSPERRPL